MSEEENTATVEVKPEAETTPAAAAEEETKEAPAESETKEKCCKIFVGNISFNAHDEQLEEIFAEFGTITEAAIIKDRMTGMSRGYGFVTFEDSESVQKAIDAMNLKEKFGRPLNVKTADSKNTGGGYRRSGGRNGYYQRQNYNNGYGYGDGGFGEYYNQGGYDDGYGYGGGYGGGPMSKFYLMYINCTTIILNFPFVKIMLIKNQPLTMYLSKTIRIKHTF